jgi:hypothetical protein
MCSYSKNPSRKPNELDLGLAQKTWNNLDRATSCLRTFNCHMFRRSIFTGWLLGLILWNTVLFGAGGIFVCLHNDGQSHTSAGGSELACCHTQDPGEAPAGLVPNCDNCNDINIEGIEFQNVRNNDHHIPVLSDSLGSYGSDLFAFHGNEVSTNSTSPRAPPSLEYECLLVVKSTVFRL